MSSTEQIKNFNENVAYFKELLNTFNVLLNFEGKVSKNSDENDENNLSDEDQKNIINTYGTIKQLIEYFRDTVITSYEQIILYHFGVDNADYAKLKGYEKNFKTNDDNPLFKIVEKREEIDLSDTLPNVFKINSFSHIYNFKMNTTLTSIYNVKDTTKIEGPWEKIPDSKSKYLSIATESIKLIINFTKACIQFIQIFDIIKTNKTYYDEVIKLVNTTIYNTLTKEEKQKLLETPNHPIKSNPLTVQQFIDLNNNIIITIRDEKTGDKKDMDYITETFPLNKDELKSLPNLQKCQQEKECPTPDQSVLLPRPKPGGANLNQETTSVGEQLNEIGRILQEFETQNQELPLKKRTRKLNS
jgi:hypothetical protein